MVLDFMTNLDYNMQADNLKCKQPEQNVEKSRSLVERARLENRVYPTRVSRVRIPPSPPNKNRNFDTKRIGVTVLTFWQKTACLRHFCTQRPQKKTRPGCFHGRVFAFAWASWSS